MGSPTQGMNAALSETEFRQLRAYIEKNCGIALGDEKTYLIESRLSGILVSSGSASFAELYAKAVGDRTLSLRDKIVDAMTTNETLWFRDEGPFTILDDLLLKDFEAMIVSGKKAKIRIWSAGCSTGQEPYSIAMTLCEYKRKHPSFPLDRVEILASDISPSVLFLAVSGRYDNLSISRGLPEMLRDRYFEFNGKIWILKDVVRKMVTFKKLNLQEDLRHLGPFDAVFCRYVIIYFSTEFKKRLLAQFADLLRPNGYLFLGGAESVSGYTSEFHILTHKNKMYYHVMQGRSE